MEYQCSVCHQKVSGDMLIYKEHTDKHILELVKLDHPDWVDDGGICQQCVAYYQKELRGGVFGDAACAKRRRATKSFFQTITGLLKGKS